MELVPGEVLAITVHRDEGAPAGDLHVMMFVEDSYNGRFVAQHVAWVLDAIGSGEQPNGIVDGVLEFGRREREA
jgi:hypothetical protein